MNKVILISSLLTVFLIILISLLDLSKTGMFIKETSPLALTIGVSAIIAIIGISFAFLWKSKD